MKQEFSVATQASATASPPILPQSREIELKFLTNDAGFKAAQNWPALDPARPRGRTLRSRYFDTPEGDLERHAITLRIRNNGRAFLMTLKWRGNFSGGLFERGEIEVPSPTAQPDCDLFGAEIAAMLARVIQNRKLAAVFETDIHRILRRISSGSSEIEIAFDRGHILAGGRRLAVREIEMELKSGEAAELYRQGMALVQAYPVQLGTLAKSCRGAMLACARLPAPVRGFSPLAGEPSIDAAIASILNGCLAQFTGNWPAFEAGDAVSAIHQMRVALRRLRSLLGLFQRAFPGAGFAAFGSSAKEIAAALGDARNWDVFLELLREGPVRAFPEVAGLHGILAQSEQHRATEYAKIRQLLASPRTSCFVLSLQAFVARHGWRNAMAPEALPRLTEPAGSFAAANLDRMRAKLARRGKDLAGLTPHERHRVRIGLKKLRYAADLFAGVLAPAEMRAYSRITAKLQNQLGRFNDLITAHDMVARLDIATPDASFASGLITGWCGRGTLQDDKALAGAWKKFRKLKPVSI